MHPIHGKKDTIHTANNKVLCEVVLHVLEWIVCVKRSRRTEELLLQ